MNIKHEHFIGIYENAFSKEYCDKVINFFEEMEEAGYCVNRQQQDSVEKTLKDDLAVFGSQRHGLSLLADKMLQQHFNEVFWSSCYSVYAEKFWSLKDCGPHTSYTFKVQKTEPGQGYHVWHCESGSRDTCNRLLAWMVYLNDVEEGGETEFIYQHMRVKPKQGTAVIWPAGFTHTHRGNPPLSGTKYIVTGWVEF